MVPYPSQCLETGGSSERAWGEGQAGSLEKSWCREVSALGGGEAQGGDGGGVQVGEESRADPFVLPEAEECWASSGHNLRISCSGEEGCGSDQLSNQSTQRASPGRRCSARITSFVVFAVVQVRDDAVSHKSSVKVAQTVHQATDTKEHIKPKPNHPLQRPRSQPHHIPPKSPSTPRDPALCDSPSPSPSNERCIWLREYHKHENATSAPSVAARAYGPSSIVALQRPASLASAEGECFDR
jgi:hypothetical protein